MFPNVKWLDEWKEAFGWITAGLVVVVVCFMATFPYGALHARITAELNRATGMDVRVADWTVGWPLAIEWRNVTLSKPDWGPIQFALLHAKVSVFKALAGGLGLDVTVHVDEATPNVGVIKGAITASSFSFVGPVAAKGQFQQIDLSKIIRRYVSHGVLTGNFTQRVESARPTAGAIKGEGTWKAEVKDLTVDQIPTGNGRMLSLAFSQVAAGLTCHDAACDITELKGEGIDGSFTGGGKVTIQQPIENSQLALTVTVIPGAGFASKAATLGLPPLPPGTPMTVKIVGTLAQARVAL